jgi:hypothetical protein
MVALFELEPLIENKGLEGDATQPWLVALLHRRIFFFLKTIYCRRTLLPSFSATEFSEIVSRQSEPAWNEEAVARSLSEVALIAQPANLKRCSRSIP